MLYWIGVHHVWYCSVKRSINAFVHTVQCIFSLTGQVLSFNWEFFPVIPHVGAHSIVVRLFHGVQLWWRVLCYHSNNNILNSQGKSTAFFSAYIAWENSQPFHHHWFPCEMTSQFRVQKLHLGTGNPGSLFGSRTGFITWVNIENIWGEV